MKRLRSMLTAAFVLLGFGLTSAPGAAPSEASEGRAGQHALAAGAGAVTGAGRQAANVLPDGRMFWADDFDGDDRTDVLAFSPHDRNWWLGTYNAGRLEWAAAGNTDGFGSAPAGCMVWDEDFDGDGRADLLFFYPGDRNWWLGSLDRGQLRWRLAGNTARFGNAPAGCMVWDEDFDGDGQADILFFYPGDKNWWLGSFDGSQLQWELVGNTAGFGTAPLGRPAWGEDFDGDGQADILFHNPPDGNWWLGSFDGARLAWRPAGNTRGFGNGGDGRPFWTDDFDGDGQTDVLFHYPADGNWWMGSHDGSKLAWGPAGNTNGFGRIWGRCLFWVADFNGDGPADVLFHNPPDGNWWMGSHDGSRLVWKPAGNTAGFGNGGDGRPFWVGDFDGDEQADLLFYYPPDGNWWLGSHDGSELRWSPAGNFSNGLTSVTIGGRVSYGIAPLAGVTVSLSGSRAESATTDADGRYAFNVSAGGDYAVSPSAPGYEFSPAARSFNKVWANQTADFGATSLTRPPAVASGQRVGRKAARNADGRLEVFAVGGDRALWHRWQVAPNGGWSHWESLGDGLSIVSEPVAIQNADGRLEVFAVAAHRALVHRWQVTPGGGWSARHSLDGPVYGNPSLAMNADGRLEAFAAGPDGTLWHKFQWAPNGGWSGWASLKGGLASDPVAAVNADGRLEVFAVGTDSALWHLWQVAPNSGWSGWASLGGIVTAVPALGMNADGRLEVFVRGADYALYHKFQWAPNSGWSDWGGLGGYLTSNPAVASNADGRLEVFVRGADYTLQHRYQHAPNSGWLFWESLGGYLTSGPAVGRNADGRLEVFVRGGDYGLYHKFQWSPNSGWSDWGGLGGYLEIF